MLSLSLSANRFSPNYDDFKHSTPAVQFYDDKWKQIFEIFSVDPLVDNDTGMLRFGVCKKKVEKYIRRKVKSGISPEIRGLYWKCIAQTNTFKCKAILI